MSDLTSWTPSAHTRPALCENLEQKVCVFGNADGVENHLSRSLPKIHPTHKLHTLYLDLLKTPNTDIHIIFTQQFSSFPLT